jgi:hypothetical protein
MARQWIRALVGADERRVPSLSARLAAEIGESDEAERCAQFLQQLDPAGPSV